MAHVEPAAPADLDAVRSLLAAAGLPTSDLTPASPQFLVVHEAGRIVAAGALERFGSDALLRSVAVAPEQRSQGLGRLMVRELERLASSSGVAQLVLLTMTASDFFAGLGYRIIDRTSAPAAVQRSAEFRSLCPSSATCMAKRLDTRQV